MKQALIIYSSRTGVTREYGEEMAKFLRQNGLETNVRDLDEWKEEEVKAADLMLIGCWTSGLFVILQHPNNEWKKMVRGLPDLSGKRIGIFTTYMLASGSMFRNMIRHLKPTGAVVLKKLKSREGGLSEDDRHKLKWLMTD